MKKVYSFCWDCGRVGTVEGVFVADDKEVERNIGKEVYFGEILGKHSEIYGILGAEDLSIKTGDQDFIDKLVEIFGGETISGYNPLEYIDGNE